MKKGKELMSRESGAKRKGKGRGSAPQREGAAKKAKGGNDGEQGALCW
jgi:hypothetical protein